MVFCAVYDCTNHTKKGPGDENVATVGFYAIPKIITHQCQKTKELTTRRRAEWLRRINRKDIDRSASHYKICGKHFISGKPAYVMNEADPDWAPSMHLGHGREANSDAAASRRMRQQRRSEMAAKPLLELQPDTPDRNDGSPPPSVQFQAEADLPVAEQVGENEQQEACVAECNKEKADFTQTTDVTMEQIELLEKENNFLLSELVDAKSKLEKYRMTEVTLKENRDMLHFYTGLPNFAILLGLFELLKRSVPHTSRNCLTQFQEMLIFLMRLRLNMPLQDLAYRFHVSQPTVSRIVNRWLHASFIRLSRAVRWPERKVLRKTMPMTFRKHFGTNVAVILDCFEVFIERPSSMLPRSYTWSNYKHHNTVKFLIGIAPQGVITFISRGWCGRTSDKVITEECGVLDNLLPGDFVLADRGFTIAESVGIHCAKLVIPAFTKGKPQLSAQDVEKTRKIANVRIHVERVIGLVRNKYRILKHTLPVELLAGEENEATVLDKIVFVCAALCNLCESTVPFG